MTNFTLLKIAVSSGPLVTPTVDRWWFFGRATGDTSPMGERRWAVSSLMTYHPLPYKSAGEPPVGHQTGWRTADGPFTAIGRQTTNSGPPQTAASGLPP